MKCMSINLLTFSLLESAFLVSQFIMGLPSGMLADYFKNKTIMLLGLILLMLNPITIIKLDFHL